MSRKICILIACLLLVFNCSKTTTNLPLTNDTAKNNEIVKAFIPSGTFAANAITKMEQEGFSCKIMRDEKVRNLKDTMQANKNSTVDFIWCERKTGTVFPRRLQVMMSLDSEDKVDNVSVTTGL
jgi:hypothetical protein